ETRTAEHYTLSLHDALPISSAEGGGDDAVASELLRQWLVLVQPGQDFLDQPCAWNEMAALLHHIALLAGRSAQQAEHRDLRTLEREEEVIPPVDHQRGDPDPRKEIDR